MLAPVDDGDEASRVARARKPMTDFVLLGRSSSHYTRTARIFALELGVPHTFRPVLDLTSPDVATYEGNPALKVPVLVDAEGPLFGTENICRALARRSEARARVVLRGDVADRLVENVEEMTHHVMSTEVVLVMAKMAAGDERAVPPKVRRSLENALAYLNGNLDHALDALPGGRALSFLEVALFCTVTHLPWRQVADVAGYERLTAFCARFGERASARQTEYQFDAP
jgi:glutathione S-transferase